MADLKKISSKKKKTGPVLPRRVRTGLAGAPIDKGFGVLLHYFREEVERKNITNLTKDYVKKSFSKAESSKILALPEWCFYVNPSHAAAIYWQNMGFEFDEKYKAYPSHLKSYYKGLLSKNYTTSTDQDDDETPSKPVIKKLSPAELLVNKVNSTVMLELDDIEDSWIAGKTVTFDLYNAFQRHDLKGAAVNIVYERLQRWLSEVSDACNKICEQAVEAYSHVSKAEMKRRLSLIETMISDLDRVKAASAATRKSKAPKIRTADKQVKALKYLKEDNTYKLKSINPTQIPGAKRLYVFNVKTRIISEYVTLSTNGFEIKGTSIQNFDRELSRSTRLRNPEKFLPIVNSKSITQIDKEWKNLTTKTVMPNGRINGDTILMRINDR